MFIAKFGGTSVSSASRIQTICEIVEKERNQQPIVVVSALAGVTNLLLSLPSVSQTDKTKVLQELREIHKNLIEDFFQDKKVQEDILSYVDSQLAALDEISKKNLEAKELLDSIGAFGEIISSFIVACALEAKGIAAQQVLATKLIITDDNFGSAEFLPKPTEIRMKKILKPLVKDGIVPVVTGFIGATRDGRTTTLSRGGSDYTASIVGFCLRAKEIQIWTDVDGIFTADPKIVKDAKLIKIISFKEAAELATFGAKVLHPKTLKPAMKANIPIRVLNSFNPLGKGTLIVAKPMFSHPIRAVCMKRNITLVNIYSEEMLLQKGFLARVFAIFAKNGISIDIVSVSEVSVSLTLDNDEMLKEAVRELRVFSIITIKRNNGIISVIGQGVSQSAHTISKVFSILAKENIPVRMVSIGATDINISVVVVANKDVEKAVRKLHDIIIRL